MKECPPGHYCPAGENQPIQCKKGYYNPEDKSESIDDCLVCPAGTACNKSGINAYEGYYCKPGFYCPENSYQ